MFQSGPRLARTSTAPWTSASSEVPREPGRTGSESTMTGSCSEAEITGWLSMGLPWMARLNPSCRSCSMAGSGIWMPERAPVPVVSTTLM